ncbi:6-phosphofructokinase [Soehngenia longivitae]|uniref:Pyrophosphate--fructose 6-phosphate 1-phosphotransferase n=1 Tax=Soehngenia longivitae TaxID=2562294 RepID=A0A4Z0D988_9FIRM|nr:6-phosphofructokinase [Soehngenia longivitae]TFZ41402.1 6-phosphofructokinase [Soehngenia longivitae]
MSKNCLVAQSGGPTAVINASISGILDANIKYKEFEKIYGAKNGIEGVMDGKLIDLSNLTKEEIDLLKLTPASALGSCRHKMKDFNEDEKEYEMILETLEKYNIDTFFYIGGNDSMDTVHKLSLYVKQKGIDKKIIGIPKTIDNDLMETDFTPGFGSAAKYIATTVLETYLDASVYKDNGVFIVETMGRDAGWLASSSVLAKIDGKPVVDFIYLPENPFDKEKFLADVKKCYEDKKQVYIVASEGLKDANGDYVFKSKTIEVHDKFAHAQLGGVGSYLKSIIEQANITHRIKVLELGTAQRAAMHCASLTDVNISHLCGFRAYEMRFEGKSGFMAGIKIKSMLPFETEIVEIDPSLVANKVKEIPREWMTDNFVKEELVEYLTPLIQGQPEIEYENGLPKYVKLI